MANRRAQIKQEVAPTGTFCKDAGKNPQPPSRCRKAIEALKPGEVWANLPLVWADGAGHQRRVSVAPRLIGPSASSQTGSQAKADGPHSRDATCSYAIDRTRCPCFHHTIDPEGVCRSQMDFNPAPPPPCRLDRIDPAARRRQVCKAAAMAAAVNKTAL